MIFAVSLYSCYKIDGTYLRDVYSKHSGRVEIMSFFPKTESVFAILSIAEASQCKVIKMLAF